MRSLRQPDIIPILTYEAHVYLRTNRDTFLPDGPPIPFEDRDEAETFALALTNGDTDDAIAVDLFLSGHHRPFASFGGDDFAD